MGLTFEGKKILESSLRSNEDKSVQYTTATLKRGRTRQRTTLESTGGPAGEIDWRARTFAIAGAGSARPISELKTQYRAFSSSRCWTWSEAEYNVKYQSEERMWTVLFWDGAQAASFSPRTNPRFGCRSPGVLEISPEVSSEEERTFIILILLYSETKRRERSAAALLPEALQSMAEAGE
ncbi:hypothetical protein C8J57DRAFT_1537616 [Mycena rebaudengoi]|nr:hypothetical protein C8J57DRAFT_1537616 [Mycena rebaudengoi]